MDIRVEEPDDFEAVHALIGAAFDSEGEVALVRQLRDVVGTISLVATGEGQVLGHILFSVCDVQGVPAMALAPVAVRPDAQRQGVGKALVWAGLDACREAGQRLVIVLGHPSYYPKFGFIRAQPLGIMSPWKVSDPHYMVLELVEGALEGVSGTVSYHPAFSEV